MRKRFKGREGGRGGGVGDLLEFQADLSSPLCWHSEIDIFFLRCLACSLLFKSGGSLRRVLAPTFISGTCGSYSPISWRLGTGCRGRRLFRLNAGNGLGHTGNPAEIHTQSAGGTCRAAVTNTALALTDTAYPFFPTGRKTQDVPHFWKIPFFSFTSHFGKYRYQPQHITAQPTTVPLRRATSTAFPV
jgi:hypothetical protein